MVNYFSLPSFACHSYLWGSLLKSAKQHTQEKEKTVVEVEWSLLISALNQNQCSSEASDMHKRVYWRKSKPCLVDAGSENGRSLLSSLLLVCLNTAWNLIPLLFLHFFLAICMKKIDLNATPSLNIGLNSCPRTPEWLVDLKQMTFKINPHVTCLTSAGSAIFSIHGNVGAINHFLPWHHSNDHSNTV